MARAGRDPVADAMPCAGLVATIGATLAAQRKGDFEKQNTVVLAVSSASPEKNKASAELGGLCARLLSDEDHENARRFTSFDDFEELELHSTILIDAQGRVHWKRTGGDPFTDMDFLLQSLKRMNGKPETTQAVK